MMINEIRTLNELWRHAVARFGDDEFVRFKRDGAWQSLTFAEMAGRVRELALGLLRLGIKPGERVAIWSENRPEWNIADLAVLATGGADVPIYTTQSRHHVEYILNDSRTRAIFVSAGFLNEALALRERLPSLQYIISFDSI